MEFKEWYEDFVSNKSNLSNLSIEKMLEKAFIAGMKYMEEATPLIGKDTQTGELVELPRESSFESSEEKLFISDEELESFDLKEWLSWNDE